MPPALRLIARSEQRCPGDLLVQYVPLVGSARQPSTPQDCSYPRPPTCIFQLIIVLARHCDRLRRKELSLSPTHLRVIFSQLQDGAILQLVIDLLKLPIFLIILLRNI